MIAAVVPMKPLADAKRRLATILPDAVRRELVATMLGEVLYHLRACPAVATRLVVTADPVLATLAERHGAQVLTEPRATGLNEAARAAASRLHMEGVETMLFLPGDVPLTSPQEIQRLIEAAKGRRMIAVPAHDGDGTNALLLSPPQALDPAFGPGSFERHIESGQAAGLDPVMLRLAGAARDIDRVEDVMMLAVRRRDDPRYAFLHEAASAGRLQSVEAV